MVIAGLQKMTLLDYPGKVACTVFLQGCNFRCPFCHNSGLLGNCQQPQVSRQALLDFLNKRKGILDGVCITGGEPTLQKELPQLIREIKALGFAVKLDTNGSDPQMLMALAEEGLLDYVAMDIKNCPNKYSQTAGIPHPDLEKIRQSMAFLMEGAIPYEFRTTVVSELHTPEDIASIGQWFLEVSPKNKVKKYFLQPYTDRESVLCGGLHAPEQAALASFLDIISPFVHRAEIRGYEG